MPRNGIQVKNPVELKSCAQAGNEPPLVSQVSHCVFPSRLPECNIVQIYTPKSKAILTLHDNRCVLWFYMPAIFSFTQFFVKIYCKIPDIFYYTVYTTFKNIENKIVEE